MAMGGVDGDADGDGDGEGVGEGVGVGSALCEADAGDEAALGEVALGEVTPAAPVVDPHPVIERIAAITSSRFKAVGA